MQSQLPVSPTSKNQSLKFLAGIGFAAVILFLSAKIASDLPFPSSNPTGTSSAGPCNLAIRKELMNFALGTKLANAVDQPFSPWKATIKTWSDNLFECSKEGLKEQISEAKAIDFQLSEFVIVEAMSGVESNCESKDLLSQCRKASIPLRLPLLKLENNQVLPTDVELAERLHTFFLSSRCERTTAEELFRQVNTDMPDNLIRQACLARIAERGNLGSAPELKSEVSRRCSDLMRNFLLAMGLIGAMALTGLIAIVMCIVQHLRKTEKPVAVKYAFKISKMTILFGPPLWYLGASFIASVIAMILSFLAGPSLCSLAVQLALVSLVGRQVYATVRKHKAASFSELFGLKLKTEKYNLAQLLSVGALAFCASIFINIALNVCTPHVESRLYMTKDVARALCGIQIVSLFLTTGVAGPFVEEVLFRGFVFPALGFYMPVLPAMLVSSLLFAAMHMDFQWPILLHLIFAGMVYAYVYRRTGSIVPAIVAHGLGNAYCLAYAVWFLTVPV